MIATALKTVILFMLYLALRSPVMMLVLGFAGGVVAYHFFPEQIQTLLGGGFEYIEGLVRGD